MREPSIHSILLSFDSPNAWYGKDNFVLTSGALAIGEHEAVGIIGKNGAGKTTLINSLCGIHKQASFGNFYFMGKASSVDDSYFKRNRYVCFAKDESFKYWDFNKLTRLIELSFSVDHDADYLNRLTEGFALSSLQTTRLSRLSSGQRKKTALASALYARRNLLFLDEPVDFLDFSSTEFLYAAIKSYVQNYGSILMCSHIAESFTRCCSKLYLLGNNAIQGPFDVPERAEDVAKLLS